ncbi:sugar transferase [Dyadobacter sp. CY326]|uniref:sugar transferase n=1 Tax=Dyadobacter sp. CY326 TaxID=2907300 RepID=UPI001F1E9DE7|nr:sugar transferase [Dyadobacter sp. CY326]MCE7067684.1 sugar transferase [Dyadobacter sp. CY326]
MMFLKQHIESCGKQIRSVIRRFSDACNVVYFKIGKRILDIFLAAAGLIILSPLFILIIVILWLENKGNVFFFQARPGLNEQIFVLVKFRTLSDIEQGNKTLHRATRIAKLLRKSSLDEIPQLWNVLKGDMSFVGPRPLLPEYLGLYNASQQIRHAVLPGITGWAQVKGRIAITWERKFELDIWYVENRSFKLDMKIMLLTFINVLKQKDARSPSEFERFKG